MSTPARSEESVAPAGTVPPARTWWRRPAFRNAVGIAVFAGLVLTPLATSRHLVWNLGHGWTLDLDPRDVAGYAAFLLLPFYRRTSHRKRDLLIVALVPFYGELVAATIVSRLIALPRRDWTPRVDELPRVVRIPGGRGAYVLPPSFPAAELLRDEWCRNPDHDHPYLSWEDAQTLFCQSARG
jgi:hypothetical protein